LLAQFFFICAYYRVELVGDAVAGSPAEFKVIDVNKVVVRGDGLGFVPVDRPASFLITAPDAQMSDIDVSITGTANQHSYRDDGFF